MARLLGEPEDVGADTARGPRPWALLVLPLAAFILYLRGWDNFHNPQFRGEDGRWFTGARELGSGAFLESYEGYYHTVCRVVAALADLLVSPAATPAFYNGAGLAIILLVVGMVLSKRCPLPARPAAALAIVLVPTSGSVFLHLTDVQTFLALGVVLIAIAGPPRSRRGAIFDAIFLLVAGLSSPYVAILAPLFIARLVVHRSRTAAVLIAIVVLTGALQAAQLLGGRAGSRPGFDPANPIWLRVVGDWFAGAYFFGAALTPRVPPTALVATAAALQAFLVIGLARARSAVGALILAAAWLAFVGAAYAYRGSPATLVPLARERYAFVPAVAVVWVLIILAARGDRSGRIGLVVLILIALGSATGFQHPPLIDRDWRRCAADIGGDLPVDIPSHPAGWWISYRPDAEGREVASDALERIVARACRLRPDAIATADDAEPRLVRFENEELAQLSPATALSWDVPKRARGFRVRHAARAATSSPWPKDGLVFRLFLRRPDGTTTELRERLLLPWVDATAHGVHTLFARLPADAAGQVVATAATAPGTIYPWWALWGEARFVGESE